MTNNTKQNRAPKASLAVSILALVVAMSGAAIAVPAQFGSKQIKDNSVKSVDLKDGKAVKGQDVRDESLTGDDVALDSLVQDDLAPDAVGSSELAANAADSEEIADNAVKPEEIAGDAVKSEEIADDAVGSSEIAANSVNALEIGPNAVGSSQIANGQVRSQDLGPMALRTQSTTIPANSSGGAFRNCPSGETRISGGAVVPAGNGRGIQSSWPNGANGWTNVIRNNTAADITVTAYVLCLQG